METLMEAGMAVLKIEGITCRSSASFYSGSLRDGSHYITLHYKQTGDRGEKKNLKDKDVETAEMGRGTKTSGRKVILSAVKVITGGTCMH